MGDTTSSDYSKINTLSHNLCYTPSFNHTQTTMAIADTGASGHYIRPHDPHQSNGTTQNTITVGLPNGDTLQSSTNNCTLNLPQRPHDARAAHIIPGLTHSSLISIETPCDAAGCEATFNKTQVIVKKDDTILITGPRDPRTGLWKFPMANPNQQTNTRLPITLECANVLQVHTGIKRMIKYLHAAAFSPVKSTWLAAITKGYYTSWPGLTTVAVQNHYPQTIATAKGHMDQT
jgi:hypothetical protein